MAETRIEKDTMGEIAVPRTATGARRHSGPSNIFSGGGAGHDAERAHQGFRHP